VRLYADRAELTNLREQVIADAALRPTYVALRTKEGRGHHERGFRHHFHPSGVAEPTAATDSHKDLTDPIFGLKGADHGTRGAAPVG